MSTYRKRSCLYPSPQHSLTLYGLYPLNSGSSGPVTVQSSQSTNVLSAKMLIGSNLPKFYAMWYLMVVKIYGFQKFKTQFNTISMTLITLCFHLFVMNVQHDVMIARVCA